LETRQQILPGFEHGMAGEQEIEPDVRDGEEQTGRMTDCRD
jgi:hypothetical protein